jgi:hypothetical protein
MGEDGVLSGRTGVVAAFGIVTSALSMSLLYAGVEGSELLTGVIANAGSLVTVGFAAAMTLWAALQFKSHEPLRRQWLLIGLGMLSYFIGDLIWAYYEVVLGIDVPFPALPDVFRMLMFPLVAAGIGLAIRSFSGLLDIRRSIVLAAVFTMLAMIALWNPVFKPAIAETEATWTAMALGVLYPVFDLWLLLFPALALAIPLPEFAGGRIAWAWWTVAFGGVAFCASDTMFLVLTNTGSYHTGNPIDLGWWLGSAAIATGASIVVDVQKPRVSVGVMVDEPECV